MPRGNWDDSGTDPFTAAQNKDIILNGVYNAGKVPGSYQTQTFSCHNFIVPTAFKQEKKEKEKLFARAKKMHLDNSACNHHKHTQIQSILKPSVTPASHTKGDRERK